MFCLLASKVRLQDRSDAIRFFDVALDGAGQLLVVKDLEPRGLAVVGSLAAGLVEEPLLGQEGFFCSWGKGEDVLGVVGGDEIPEVLKSALLGQNEIWGLNYCFGSWPFQEYVWVRERQSNLLDDGAGLPESDARVGVVDCGEATVGVNGDVLGVLDGCEGDGDGFVGDLELL